MSNEPLPPRSLPRNVMTLGAVSMLMGISSTMVLALLPAFLVVVLGASVLWVGTIEGIAESTASITKIFCGAISDWIGRRKPLVIVGYGLSACVKILFPLAETVSQVLFARVVDRIGKGIRDAPRDAFIADITTRRQRGSGFGLRHALFSVGAVLGPLLAIALMTLKHDNFRVVYWFAVVPAFLAVGMLIWQVDELAANGMPSGQTRRFEFHNLRRLSPEFWRIVAFASVLSLARFSQVFLLLKGLDVGVDAAFVPLVLVLVNSVYSTSSYPVGLLADRLGRRLLLGGGGTVLILAELVLAISTTPVATAVGAALWGLQMGATQGLLGAAVADAVPDELRGTAFGTFDLIIGIAALVASTLAGMLWVIGGATLTFLVGGLLAGVALVIFGMGSRWDGNVESAAV